MDPALNIVEDTEERDGEKWSVLRVQGEPRAATADPLEATLKRHVSADGCRVLVRFEDAIYVDSTVIGLLLSSVAKAREVRGLLRVEFPEKLAARIRRMFGLYGGDDWLVSRG